MAREHSVHYLNQEIMAMRWLSEQGLSPAEIRLMRWGDVDETTKKIRLDQQVFLIRYDKRWNAMTRDSYTKKLWVEVTDKQLADFFFKSPMYCSWVFTAHRPKTWRREGSKAALFPVEVVEKYCQNNCSIDCISLLTFLEDFATIEVSKLNITNSKPKELIKEAEVVEN